MKAQNVKILIVEDHPLTRAGIRMIIGTALPISSIIDEMDSVQSVMAFLKNKPELDLVLLDLHLPDGSGLDIAQFLKTNMPSVKIVVCSMHFTKADIAKLINWGVEGFVDKQNEEAVLKEAITTVMGGCYFGKDKMEVFLKLDAADDDSELSTLTDREKQIMTLSAKGKLVPEIAKELFISKRTVEVHKAHIFKKIGVKNSIEMVRYAYDNGFANADKSNE